MENNNETRIEVDNNQEIDTSVDYISALNEMKKNTVSRADYDKLRDENKKLINTLVEGGSIQNVEVTPPKDINKLRSELFNTNNNLNNLEYVKRAIELRDAIIESGEPDPFLPVSSRYTPTLEEIQKAQNAAEIYKECIEYANGDSQIFTQELMRRTVDVNPSLNRRR